MVRPRAREPVLDRSAASSETERKDGAEFKNVADPFIAAGAVAGEAADRRGSVAASQA
jgi:hypothetical protein